jgi:predicted permease
VVSDAEVWRPGRLNRASPARGMVVLHMLARLARGVELRQAQASAHALSGRLQQTFPDSNTGVTLTLQPLHEEIVGDIRSSLLVLLAAVGFVLLIACANVANLPLARASGRNREIAVRLAIGASRGRIVRQLLTESLLLAAIGGALGLLVGMWGVSALASVVPANLPAIGRVQIEPQVLAFATLVTIATGVLFGLMPAVVASRSSLGSALKTDGRGTAGRGGQRMRQGLVVAEIAVALVLLVGSGLLLRTFLRLQAADLGFNPEGVLVGAVLPPQRSYPNREALVAPGRPAREDQQCCQASRPRR